jgi:hypothetical protein
VRAARLERVFPDRFRVRLGLRRPLCEVVVAGGRRAVVDRDGIAMRPTEEPTELPRIDLRHEVGALVARPVRFGEPFPDDRVLAAAAVAAEWRDVIRASCPGAPRLLEIDPHNLGWRFLAHPSYTQIVVLLERSDGGVASFQYGLSEAHGGPVSAADRAEVLCKILAEFPGLAGIENGDLRLRNLWRQALRPRQRAVGALR